MPDVRSRYKNVRGRISKTFFWFLFLGKMVYVPTADPTSPKEMYEGLNTSPIQCLGGFDVSTDDPRNYTDKNQFVDHRRQWPRKPYPPGADLDEDPLGRAAQFAAGSSGAGPSTSSAPQAAPAISPAMLEMRKNLQQYHHDLVRLCSKAGIPDVCANFKETRVEKHLEGPVLQRFFTASCVKRSIPTLLT